jgi:hypothetical protein
MDGFVEDMSTLRYTYKPVRNHKVIYKHEEI